MTIISRRIVPAALAAVSYTHLGEGYDEYADYGPGYDENAHSGRYDSYAPVTTRSAGVGSARGARSSRTEPALPKLVSIDDVRAHTQLPDSLTRDPLPPRRVSSASALGYRGERTMVAVSYTHLRRS